MKKSPVLVSGTAHQNSVCWSAPSSKAAHIGTGAVRCQSVLDATRIGHLGRLPLPAVAVIHDPPAPSTRAGATAPAQGRRADSPRNSLVLLAAPSSNQWTQGSIGWLTESIPSFGFFRCRSPVRVKLATQCLGGDPA